MTVGRKDDQGKLQWSLLPVKPVEAVLRVLMFGAKKYAPGNWMRVDNAEERYFDAALRHLMAWRAGEQRDPESGQPHLAHAGCCILFMLWFEIHRCGRKPDA
jgi:hypothetical protein